jgi:hypothetical protein
MAAGVKNLGIDEFLPDAGAAGNHLAGYFTVITKKRLHWLPIAGTLHAHEVHIVCLYLLVCHTV